MSEKLFFSHMKFFFSLRKNICSVGKICSRLFQVISFMNHKTTQHTHFEAFNRTVCGNGKRKSVERRMREGAWADHFHFLIFYYIYTHHIMHGKHKIKFFISRRFSCLYSKFMLPRNYFFSLLAAECGKILKTFQWTLNFLTTQPTPIERRAMKFEHTFASSSFSWGESEWKWRKKNFSTTTWFNFHIFFSFHDWSSSVARVLPSLVLFTFQCCALFALINSRTKSNSLIYSLSRRRRVCTLFSLQVKASVKVWKKFGEIFIIWTMKFPRDFHFSSHFSFSCFFFLSLLVWQNLR